jgi:methionyl-tRNA formyltransferase
MIYDGHPTLGASLQRTEEEFDTGAIYSLHERPMPDDVSVESVFGIWRETMMLALEEGVRNAVAGLPGRPQDNEKASYAAPFTEDETWLTWNIPARQLQCRATALLWFGEARARLEAKSYRVLSLTALGSIRAPAPAGTVLARQDQVLTVCAADNVVQVLVDPVL